MWTPDYTNCPAASVLYADCPWAFGDKLPGASRGAEKNYSVLTVEDLKGYPLPPQRDDCMLFLWRVAAMQPEALAVVAAWGYTVKSEVVWAKTRGTTSEDASARRKWMGCPAHGSRAVLLAGACNACLRILTEPREHFGMGRYVRNAHEVCLIGVRKLGNNGKSLRHVPKVRNRAVRSTLHAPYRGHSAKPIEMYTLIEKLMPGPYVELFARTQQPGWHAYGDQLGEVSRPAELSG